MKNKLAIQIKTYNREQCLFNCIDSIEKNVQIPYRLYIADDGQISEKKRELYEELESQNHCILTYDHQVGVPKGRNDLTKKLKDEKFLLKLDDDFLVTEETDLRAMIKVLKNNKEIGLVSDLERQGVDTKNVGKGEIAYQQGHIWQTGPILLIAYLCLPLLEHLNLWEKEEETRYYNCSFVRNFQLIKRELLEEVKWEEKLHFQGEHLDFLLQVLRDTNFKIAFTPDSIHLHKPPNQDKRSRKSQSRMQKVLRKKWEIKHKFTTGPLNRAVRNFVPVNL